jgi:hypothetical protein
MILFALLWAMAAQAGGGCVTFDLKGKTSDTRWSEVILYIAKDFAKQSHADLPILSRRKDGKSWSGNFTCSRLNSGSFSCYGEDDRGEFRLETKAKGMKMVIEDAINVGYEEQEDARIAPKGEDEVEIVGESCKK